MKSVLLFFASIACVALVSSCSNDPVTTPGAGSVAPTYHATVQSMDGGFDAVCGAGTHDLYALGAAILHYDGNHWSSIPGPATASSEFRNALGFPDGRIVANDGRSTFILEDGKWLDIGGPQSRYMWGSAPNNLYVVSFDGVFHYDGNSWSNAEVPVSPYEIDAISGREPNDVVISGDRGLLARYDGTQWTTAHIDSIESYRSVAATSSGTVFVAGSQVYEVVDGSPQLILTRVDNPLLCTDGDALYVAGRDYGGNSTFTIRRFADGTWTTVATDQGEIDDLWVREGQIIAGGIDRFSYREPAKPFVWRGGTDGAGKERPYPYRGRFAGAATIDGAIYAVGDGAWRYENAQWTDLQKEYITRQAAVTIAGQNRRNIYAAGDEMILHYDGSNWSWVNGAFGERMNAIWVDPDGDVVAGGDTGLVQFDGNTWSQVALPIDHTPYFSGVWGAGKTIFAVGGYGTIAMRVQGTWIMAPPPTFADLRAVWGTSERDVYAVSSTSNELCHYDGRTWQPMQITGPSIGSMTSIWGTSQQDMFVLNYYGKLLHFDGHQWTEQEHVFNSGMRAVAGTYGSVLMVGDGGAALYQR